MSPSAEVERSRIQRRIVRIPPQRRALTLALRQFAGDEGELDAAIWAAAFESGDPRAINSVLEVTAGVERLVNHLAEILHSGAHLAGLPVVRRAHRPTFPELLSAVTADGCFSASQSHTLADLNQLRNRLQHASPDVEADEVFELAQLLLKTLPRLVTSMVRWLEGHDVTVIPSRR